MKIDVKMPKLGESLTEGTVLKWWKKAGDPVKKDETLLEVSTDKVDSEIPSPASGVLLEIVAREQETVAVDAVLGRLETGKHTEAEAPVVPPSAASPPLEKKETPPPPVSTGGKEIEVVMPKMGESLTEGTILKWWKKPGEAVKKDETLLEISTDKVDSEIPSPVDGIVREILHSENETVAVGEVIARIDSTGSAAGRKSLPVSGKMPAPPSGDLPPEHPGVREVRATEKTPKSERFYSPLVRMIARQEGITSRELENIAGSGIGQRVTKKDIMGYLQRRKKPMPSAAVSGENVTIIPIDNVRKRIAEHMRRSLNTSAHVYSVSECDMTAVMTLMQAHRERFLAQEGFKLTVTPFILYAVVKALLDFPRVNASLQGENIIEHHHINLGVAVAAPKGLIVPVMKKAEEKSFKGLAREIYELVIRARNNQLTLDDIQGSTFSVTNYGIFGNIIGLPIINQPNVAIMGIGAIKKRPVVIERPEGDSIGIRSVTFISMSYDHRLVDGELGGRFMQRLVEYLESMNESIF